MRERRRGRRWELLYLSVDEPAADERCVFIREQTKASSSSHGFLSSLPLFLVLLSDWRLSVSSVQRGLRSLIVKTDQVLFFYFFPHIFTSSRPSLLRLLLWQDDIFGGSGGFLNIQTQTLTWCRSDVSHIRLSCESYSARWSRYEKFVCRRRTVDLSCFQGSNSVILPF